LATIAAELETALAERQRTGAAGLAAHRPLARGDGWSVNDVICTSGPDDRPFEELFCGVSIAIVVAGTFQYRTVTGRELMTPGSLLPGNPGQRFECGHEHGTGDRCIAFRFAPDYFERIAADLGASRTMNT
jgi:AraC family transcriptional regulator